MKLKPIAMAIAACTSIASLSAGASAARTITTVDTNVSGAAPYTFDYQGSSFTFGSNGDFFNGPLTISTADGGQVNTIFGSPTTNFADGRGGPVTFGPTMNYDAFASATPIRFTNGNNFIGLRALVGTDAFYGYAFTTNNRINTIGFENVAGAAVTATTAVPEPTAWALMIGGIGMVGGMMRRRTRGRMATQAA